MKKTRKEKKQEKKQAKIEKKQRKLEEKEERKKQKEKKKQKSASSTKSIKKSINSMLQSNRPKVFIPKTTPQVISMLFQDFQDNIMRINEDTYSMCFEYTDISFSKADYEDAGAIFLKWVDFLNSFSERTHIQVTNASTPVNTEKFKSSFVFDIDELKTENEKRLGEEFNMLIDDAIGKTKNTLLTKRYITLSQKALNYEDAKGIFFNIYRRTEERFKELKSNIRIVPTNERLTLIHDFWNLQTADEKGITDFEAYAKENGRTMWETLAPKECMNIRASDYIEITPKEDLNSDEEVEGTHNKRFVRCLYVDPDFPNAITPRFYNVLTSIEDLHLITTMNIQPNETKKVIDRLRKLHSGLDAERHGKIRRYAQKNLNYEYMKDEKLETRLADVKEMIEDIQYNDQKIFCENIVMCLVADTYAELEEQTVKIQNKIGEHLIRVQPLKWQQLEGIQNTMPLGHNTLQFQHKETSEATGVHVPFNSKDFQHPKSIFHGINLVSRNPIFLDRKQLINGNGCILATSGAGKSFQVKMNAEEVFLRYPDDEIIVIDYQREYNEVVKEFSGQTITISDNTKTYINPLDLDQNYSLSEDGNDSPIKAKVEYMQGWVESIIDEGSLSPIEKSIIDRCVRHIFEEYERTRFTDKSKQPLLKDFQEELERQKESQAKDMAKALERFVKGTQDIFAHPTNVNIHNRFVCFDISELPDSIQTAGYLVVLDHIMNRLIQNRKKGINTWIYIDEFHILLSNPIGAGYVAKIVKIGRKYNALITVITQNIEDVYNNEQGRKILGNAEFAMILKQKATDRDTICNIFDISSGEARYIANDAKVGQGVIVFGPDKIPFYNPVPDDFRIYALNNTDKKAYVRG